MVPFESLGMVFYLPSTVTMDVSLAISQIFSIKEWPDLEIWVWGCWRSFKKARFDRPYTTFYWSAILLVCRNFVKMFDAGKTKMIGLPCGEKISPVRDWRPTSLECIGVGGGGGGKAIIWDRRLQVCHFACSSVYFSLYFINFLFDSVW